MCVGVGGAHRTNVGNLAYAAIAALSFFAKRDLVRDALLRWMTPFRAAISKSVSVFFTAICASSIVPLAKVRCALVREVRRLRRTERFRRDRRRVTLADLSLGTTDTLPICLSLVYLNWLIVDRPYYTK